MTQDWNITEEDKKIFSVTQLNSCVKGLLEGSFPELWVQGEISNLKTAASGHTYFDLKDDQSLIAAVFFKGYASGFKAKLENGLLALVRAQLTAYIKQGRYQLLVKEIQPQTTGSLQLAFEKLKKKLEAEGLFARERKKPIPKFPSKIAIVTSLEGAAVRDILSILKRRCANLEIIIAPVKVQGEGAKEEIAQAIHDLNANFPDIDVLLAGRGGGSIEDLWAFNEELVARAIAGSKIPVISCVGHETDFTIADFVADLRAPTPSAAAELVVQNKSDIVLHMSQLEKRLVQSLLLFYERIKGRLSNALACRFFRFPQTLWQEHAQQADSLLEELLRRMDSNISRAEQNLRAGTGRLNALSPLACLARGYSITRKLPDKDILRDCGAVKTGEKVLIQLHKGSLECEVVAERREKVDGKW